jgi:hypothetical protein
MHCMPHNQRVEPTPQRLLGQEGSCFGMILICESVISDSSLILPLVSVTWSCVSDSIEGSPGHLTRKSRRHHVCHSHRPACPYLSLRLCLEAALTWRQRVKCLSRPPKTLNEPRLDVRCDYNMCISSTMT